MDFNYRGHIPKIAERKGKVRLRIEEIEEHIRAVSEYLEVIFDDEKALRRANKLLKEYERAYSSLSGCGEYYRETDGVCAEILIYHIRGLIIERHKKMAHEVNT